MMYGGTRSPTGVTQFTTGGKDDEPVEGSAAGAETTPALSAPGDTVELIASTPSNSVDDIGLIALNTLS